MSRFFHRSKSLEPDPGHRSSADPLSISNSTPNQRATTDNDLGDTKEILNPAAVTARDLASAPAIDDTADPIERRYLVRKPQAHQWFENDVLMKASDKERVAGKFELFFDLLYVALIANFAEHLVENPTGGNVAVFLIIFATGWHAWADLKEMMNNYYNDDIVQRAYVLWVMTLLILFGNNANYVAEDISYLRITTATYQVIRATQASMFLYNSFGDFRHRAQNRGYVVSELLVILLWIPMYFEDISQGAKVAVAFVAITVEELGYIFTFGPWMAKWLGLTHRTALDIAHENDRYTAFTIIVLGEFTFAILFGSPARGGLNLNHLRAVFTLIIAFCFNAMYVYGDGAIKSMHPARRSAISATTWLLIHLPMSGGLLIGGHVSASSTYHEMDDGRRWLFGGGLAIGYFTLWVMSYLFKDHDTCDQKFRTLPRLISAIILVLSPLTSHEQFDDTSLLGIGTALSAFTVIWETYGGLEKGACFLESWKDDPASESKGHIHLG